MMKQTAGEEDWHLFMRARAEQLWLEGSKDEARELLRQIDDEQRQRFEQCLELALVASK